MPTPPFTCRSAQPTGGGFAISNNLKQRKAKAIQASDQGTKKSAIQTPTISSHTIHPGSASFSRFAAYSQIKQPNAAATRIAPPLTYQGAVIKGKKSKTPTTLPMVPGPRRHSPDPNPNARHIIGSFNIEGDSFMRSARILLPSVGPTLKHPLEGCETAHPWPR